MLISGDDARYQPYLDLVPILNDSSGDHRDQFDALMMDIMRQELVALVVECIVFLATIASTEYQFPLGHGVKIRALRDRFLKAGAINDLAQPASFGALLAA